VQAVEAGYNGYGVVDTSGGLVTIRENAVAKNERSRDHTINWATVAAELQRIWSLPTGMDLGRVFHDPHRYSLLMDRFKFVTKKPPARRPSSTHCSTRRDPISLSRSGSRGPQYVRNTFHRDFRKVAAAAGIFLTHAQGCFWY
jgi:hypothetical protein